MDGISFVTWETIKLAIVIPWGFDLIWRRTWETYEELQKPPNHRLIFGTGRTPARRHEIGCEEALRWGASHILILGGDEIYPESDMIRRMFRWMEITNLDQWMNRKKVVNCLVPIRGHRPGQGTRPFQPIGMSIDYDTQELKKITREDGPIVRAEVIGTGVMLFEASILKSMKKPWFGDEYYPGTNDVNKMQDVAFVEKLNDMGCQVWCDTQIIVKHIGVLEIDDSFQWRFE
jgi:hypothetical protein